jgi:hypothetical protein
MSESPKKSAAITLFVDDLQRSKANPGGHVWEFAQPLQRTRS